MYGSPHFIEPDYDGEDEIAPEMVEPRDWSHAGVLLAFQPFNWSLGIGRPWKAGMDRSMWRVIAFDIGPFRFTVAWP